MPTLAKESWQDALSDLITDPKELWKLLQLDPSTLDAGLIASEQFSLKVPRNFLKRIEKGNPDDPLLKQILPLGAELLNVPNYTFDPLQEAEANPIKGLLHKYETRVLVTLTSACAVHCRYCFRRHFAYTENNPGRSGWEKLFAYIKNDEKINEVILSGGDPLAVSDNLLQSFTEQLNELRQIKRLRIHTRLPIVLPERITDNFVNWLRQLKQQIIIVFHVNHPNEINDEVKNVLALLKKSNVTLLNQAVLLKDVNDDVETLAELSEKLISASVLPYYLHMPDKVAGTAHFDVTEENAKNIYAELQKKLPGYLVPRLVREEATKLSKTIL